MKIGIFGNTNNYPFALARGFRRLGVDTVLLVNRKEPLHRPESKNLSLAKGYPNWIIDCSDVAEDDFVVESSRIAEILDRLTQDVSGLVLNQIGPSLGVHTDIPAISLLTGSDLTYYANYETIDTRSAGWDPSYKSSAEGRLASKRWGEFVARQRKGIAISRAVSFAFPGQIPDGDALLKDIGVSDVRRFQVCLADTGDLAPVPPRLRNRLRIFNGARLNWKNPFPAGFSSLDNKRTDILLKGFSAFLRAGGDGTLVLVEKGLHVAETMALATALDLTRHIEWRKEMTLAAFYQQVRDADVVCDQLGLAIPGMAAVDAMAIGRPVIANFRTDILKRHFPVQWPVCHVESPEDVCEKLLRLHQSPHEREAIGRQARAFAEQYLSPETNALRCLQLLGLAH